MLKRVNGVSYYDNLPKIVMIIISKHKILQKKTTKLNSRSTRDKMIASILK